MVHFRLACYRLDYSLRLEGGLTTTAAIPLHVAFETAYADPDDDQAMLELPGEYGT